jgi:hypothetical protein
MAEGRRQKVEGRGQKAEGRRQKAEGRRQKGKDGYPVVAAVRSVLTHLTTAINHWQVLVTCRLTSHVQVEIEPKKQVVG